MADIFDQIEASNNPKKKDIFDEIEAVSTSPDINIEEANPIGSSMGARASIPATRSMGPSISPEDQSVDLSNLFEGYKPNIKDVALAATGTKPLATLFDVLGRTASTLPAITEEAVLTLKDDPNLREPNPSNITKAFAGEKQGSMSRTIASLFGAPDPYRFPENLGPVGGSTLDIVTDEISKLESDLTGTEFIPESVKTDPNLAVRDGEVFDISGNPPVIKEIIASFANPLEWASGAAINKLVQMSKIMPKTQFAGVVDDLLKQDDIPQEAVDELLQLRKGVYEYKPNSLPPSAYSEVRDDIFGRSVVNPNYELKKTIVDQSIPYTAAGDETKSIAVKAQDLVDQKLFPDVESATIYLNKNPIKSSGEFMVAAPSGKRVRNAAWNPAYYNADLTYVDDLKKLPEPQATKKLYQKTPGEIKRMDFPETFSVKVGDALPPPKGSQTSFDEVLKPKEPPLNLEDIRNLDDLKTAAKDPRLTDPFEAANQKTLKALFDGESTKKDLVFNKTPKPLNMMTEEEASSLATKTKPKLTEKIASQDPTKPPKTGFFLKSLRTRLNNIGASILVDKVDNLEMQLAQKIGRSQKVLEHSFKSLDDGEFENLVDVLDSGAIPFNKKVATASENIKTEFDKVADIAEGQIPGYKRLKNYFPRQYTDDVLDKLKNNDDFLREKAGELVKQGQFDGDITKAEDYLREAFRKKLGSKKFGSIDYHRVHGLDGWIRDPRVVLPKYFEGAWKRVLTAQEFGLEQGSQEIPEIWAKLVTELKSKYKGQDVTKIDKLLNDARQAVFNDYRPLSESARLSGVARNFEVLSKLGLAQITNAGQTTNTAIRTSFSDTVKGLFKVIKNNQESYDFAKDAGALVNRMTDDITNTGLSQNSLSQKLASKFLKYSGFESVEQFNRVLAANTAEIYVNRQFSNLLKNSSNTLARRKLTELGINVDEALKRGHLTEKNILDSAFKINKQTQFTSQALDLPLLNQDPLFKLAFQFKSFAYQHGKFLKDHIYDEAKKGNYAPILRSVLAAATIGEFVVDTKAIVKDILESDFEFNRIKNRGDLLSLDRQLENFFQIGGFGLGADIIDSATYGEVALAKTFLGPALADVVEIGGALGKEGQQKQFQGKPGKIIERKLQAGGSKILGLTPIIGGTLEKTTKPDKLKPGLKKKR